MRFSKAKEFAECWSWGTAVRRSGELSMPLFAMPQFDVPVESSGRPGPERVGPDALNSAATLVISAFGLGYADRLLRPTFRLLRSFTHERKTPRHEPRRLYKGCGQIIGDRTKKRPRSFPVADRQICLLWKSRDFSSVSCSQCPPNAVRAGPTVLAALVGAGW